MNTRRITTGFALSALALAIAPAQATEIRFDGFASFVAGQVLDKDELEGSNFRGFDERLDFQQNSIFALQARADLRDRLSATVQVTAKGADNYDATFNWAYLTYEINNEWTAKLGRSRIPYFMYSDFLDVGYAYHWISPPDSVYNLGGFDSADGLSLDYQTDIGPWTSRLSMMGGRAQTTISTPDMPNADTTVADLWLISWSMNYDWFTVRAVHAVSELDIEVDLTNQLADGLSQFGVSQNAIDDMLVADDPVDFNGIGISLDQGSWFAVAEYTELGLSQSFAEDIGERWYVSGGVRFGDWTAYATVEGYKADVHERARDTILAQFDQDVATKTAQQAALGGAIAGLLAGAPVPGLTVADIPTLQANYNLLGLALMNVSDLRGGVETVFSGTANDDDIYSVGVRYNFHPSACAKLEYTEMHDNITDLKPQAIALAIDLVY